jgi:hypothetical protein
MANLLSEERRTYFSSSQVRFPFLFWAYSSEPSLLWKYEINWQARERKRGSKVPIISSKKTRVAHIKTPSPSSNDLETLQPKTTCSNRIELEKITMEKAVLNGLFFDPPLFFFNDSHRSELN